MILTELQFENGESSLSVRRFSAYEAVSTPFVASVWACSENPAVDIGAIIGKAAVLRIVMPTGAVRSWNGICSYAEQTHAERRQNKVESLYHFRIVPPLWLLDQRRNHKIF